MSCVCRSNLGLRARGRDKISGPPQVRKPRCWPIMNLARRSASDPFATRLILNRSAAPGASQSQQADPPLSSPTRVSAEYIEDQEFSISKISFGSILVPVGSVLLAYGFGAYFALLPGGDVSSLLLVYGFPMTVLGAALSYAQCTDIQRQIREDCTRFRYGDEQHLEEALDKIFRFNKANGIPRKASPVLTGLREEVVDGSYTLVLEFKAGLEMSKWEERQGKFQSFFGPGIIARIEKTAAGADVYLISDGSGDGRGGKEQKDVLLPLMPGLKARRQD